ncbi:Hypothetical protein CHV_b0025 [Cardinium endosymbiont cBtQ1 of Bemisia tabaci]|uniref:hypothetical protein n=2 Tax=Cardinium endosymbiont of Bemisia tabaci TaxID=672794 RepID=UPI000442D185|nr:hypothetical protein [Cardinium endosymbiont of Bemisia tabaci]CDG49877.1 Hypothetical protein CHV_b0025 [Cardinium endosymbiont cBtQ1 of Bemisia tabaci]
MQSMVPYHIKKYLHWVVAYTLTNCQQHHRMAVRSCSTQQRQPTPSCATAERNHPATISPLPKFVLVLLHGLNMDASENDKIKEAVAEAFREDILTIQPKCREGLKSVYLSIETQSKQVVKEIQTMLRDTYPQHDQEALQALPISIFGYSQGGLVGCILAANHSNDLNITAVITAHAPLYGTEALDNKVADVKAFTREAKSGLNAIGHPDTSQVNMQLAAWLLNGFCINKFTKFLFKGLSDMRSNSTCITRIKKFIRENKNDKENHEIPILLIGGYLSNLSEYFDYEEAYERQVEELNQHYALLATQDKHGVHDILISIKSQLCRGPSFDNIVDSSNDPVYAKNIETYVAKEQLHCWNLMLMLSDYRVQYGKTLFQNKKAIALITEFLSKHNLRNGS